MIRRFRLASLFGVIAVLGGLTVLSLAEEKTPKPPKGTTPNTGVGSGFCRVRELDGMKVKNKEGEDLGKIDDLVIELDDGQVSYAALSFGGLLGVGNKLFAIPWSALEVKTGKDAKDKYFVLGVDKERLKKAPGFDKGHWPDLADRSWSKEVDEFYATHTKTVNRSSKEAAPRK
ncbi:MAG TPA: PRC-barrel domain-containing protein [Pirellulales bacterium]|nr:PRC-barrel domain-containing protein [Pirellulales bacterium]